MNKKEIKEYLTKELIPQLENEIKENDIYQDAMNCILKVLDYYGTYVAHLHIKQGATDEETILLTLEEMTYYQQIEEGENKCENYVLYAERGIFYYDEATLEEEGLTPSDVYDICDDDGFQPTYRSITSMWRIYNLTHDIFKAVDTSVIQFLDGSSEKFAIYKKGFHPELAHSKKEIQENTIVTYTSDNYREFIKSFDDIYKYMNERDFEEDDCLFTLSFIANNYNMAKDDKKLKQLEVLNEIVNIIDNDSI